MNMEQNILSFAFKIITVMLILVVLSTVEKKRWIRKYFVRVFENMLLVYKEQGKFVKTLLVVSGMCLMMMQLLTVLQSYCLADGRTITGKSIILALFVWFLSMFIMYILFGSVMLIFTKTIKMIADIRHDKISVRMMISFLFLLILMTFALGYEKVMSDNLLFLFLGAVVCYILNINILLKLVQNPFCIVEDKMGPKKKGRTLIITSSILIVLMIIISLYLFVLCTFYLNKNAYGCVNGYITKWKLFYYTVISFTTIGYGDITPRVWESQAIAIVIAITSVICLVIFVNSVLAEKKEILEGTIAKDDNNKKI